MQAGTIEVRIITNLILRYVKVSDTVAILAIIEDPSVPFECTVESSRQVLVVDYCAKSSHWHQPRVFCEAAVLRAALGIHGEMILSKLDEAGQALVQL